MADTGVTQLKRDGYLSAIDYWLLVPVLAITLIGLYVLNQVLSTGFEDYPQNLYKQIGAVLIGIVWHWFGPDRTAVPASGWLHHLW